MTQTAFTVAGAAALADAIDAINVGGTDAADNTQYVITLTGNINLSLDLPAIDLPLGSTLLIQSFTTPPWAIQSNGSTRGLVVTSGAVTLSNIDLTGLTASGVAGGSGAAGGGGGAGLGGAVFVGDGASVTLEGVTFAQDSAQGGKGGAGTGTGSTPGAGGGAGEPGAGGSGVITGTGGSGSFGGGGGGSETGSGGAGGFGAGAGGSGASHDGGGGGLGAGGDVFVAAGGTLSIIGGTLANGTVQGGGGLSGGGKGAAYGAAIFYQGSGDIVVGSPGTATIGSIADTAGSGGGAGSGAVRLVVDGGNDVVLDGQSTFTGGVAFEDGELGITTATGAGTGVIDGAGGGTLIDLYSGAIPANVFENLAPGTVIDVHGVGAPVSYTESNGVLSVVTTTQSFTLNLVSLPGGVTVQGDGNGGAEAIIGSGPQEYVVTTGADDVSGAPVDGRMTLRDAVLSADAAGGGTIVFAPDVATVNLLQSIEISSDVQIDGATIDGAPATTIDGSGTDRVFLIDAGATVTLDGLEITGGGLVGAAGAAGQTGSTGGQGASGSQPITGDDGGEGTAGGDGGDALGAGIENLGNLTLVDSLVTGNSAQGGNGGTGGQGGTGGPGGNAVLPYSGAQPVQGGQGGNGGPGGLGGRGGNAVGGVYNGGELIQTDSSITGNTSTAGVAGNPGQSGFPGYGGQGAGGGPVGHEGYSDDLPEDAAAVQAGFATPNLLDLDIGQQAIAFGDRTLDMPTNLFVTGGQVGEQDWINRFEITNPSPYIAELAFSFPNTGPDSLVVGDGVLQDGSEYGTGNFYLQPGQTGDFYVFGPISAHDEFSDIVVTYNGVANNIKVQTTAIITSSGSYVSGSPCYCPGTMILTPHGEAAVETLAIGDVIITAAGAPAPIRWIGRRSYAGAFIAGQHLMLPVCFKKGALAGNVPHTDLFVSPGHAMFIDGQLVPAWRLVNGVTITQAAAVDAVTYIHIELARHDIMLANGAPAESFLDEAGIRGQFHNAAAFHALYPGMAPMAPLQPRLESGFGLQRIQERLRDRAGVPPSAEPAGALRGYVDQAGPRRVCGWAQDCGSPEEPVVLEISVGGMPVVTLPANAFRADLRAASIGSGCHAFDVDLPAGLAGAVTVRRVTDGAVLVQTGAAERRAAA